MMMMDWNRMMKMVNGNKQHWIDVLYQNIPLGLSSSNKEEIINQIMHSYRPHFIGVAEPRHSELETLDVPGYSLIKGMAVGIENPRLNVFVKDGVVFEILPMRTEIPAVKLKIAQTTLIFTYREWAKDGDQGTISFDKAGGQNERWEGFIKEWTKVRGKCTLLGDCNFDYWKVETQHQRNCAKIRDMVLEKMIPKGYVQCVEGDTRYQGNQQSCLDHLYTNCGGFVETVWNIPFSGYDHNLIGARHRLQTPVFHQQKIIMRKLSNLDSEEFHEMFWNLDHQDFLREKDVEKQIEILVSKIVMILDTVAPMKNVILQKKNAPHLTSELLEERKIREKLKKVAITSKKDEDWKIFKRFRNRLRHRMEARKKEWVKEQMLVKDSKRRWSSILTAAGLGGKKTADISLKVDGEVVKDEAVVAEELSAYYISKVEKIVEEHPLDPELALKYTEEYVKDKDVGHFDMKPVLASDVRKIVMLLKQTGVVGQDGISVIVIKRIIDTIVGFLTIIVNEIISQSIYPEAFKCGLISPVPKGGDLTQVKNWRPVTILNALSKVAERVVNH